MTTDDLNKIFIFPSNILIGNDGKYSTQNFNRIFPYKLIDFDLFFFTCVVGPGIIRTQTEKYNMIYIHLIIIYIYIYNNISQLCVCMFFFSNTFFEHSENNRVDLTWMNS